VHDGFDQLRREKSPVSICSEISLIRRAVTIDGAFARGRALSAAGIDLN
jgi:hypothetical protein